MAEIPDYKTLVQNINWKWDHSTLDLTDDGLKKMKEKLMRNLIICNLIGGILLFIILMVANLLINIGIETVIITDI